MDLIELKNQLLRKLDAVNLLLGESSEPPKIKGKGVAAADKPKSNRKTSKRWKKGEAEEKILPFVKSPKTQREIEEHFKKDNLYPKLQELVKAKKLAKDDSDNGITYKTV